MESARPSPSRRPRFRSDPWPLLLALVAAVVYALHGFLGALTRDTGVYAYAGQEVARGVPPYLDILNRDGPLGHLVPALGAWLAPGAGLSTVLGERVEACVLSVGVVVATYAVTRTLLASRPLGLVAAVVVLQLQAFTVLATDGPREKTAMVLLVLLAYLAAQHGRFLGAGALVALATLTIQTGFFGALPAVLVLALLERGGRLRRVGAIAAGGLLVLGLTLGAYAAIGRTATFVDDFMLLNAEYTHGTPLVDRLPAIRADLGQGYGPSLALLLAGLVAVLVVPLADLARRPETRALPRAATAFTAAAVGGLGWDLLDLDSWPDTLAVAPLAAVGLALVAAVVVRAPRRRQVLAVALVVPGLVAATVLSATTVSHGLLRQERSVRAVLGVLPGATVVSLDAPQALVLAGRTNPGVHQIFAAAMVKEMQRTVAGGLPGFVDRLRSVERPDLVAVGTRDEAGLGRRLRHQYVEVGDAPGWQWWARADLGLGRIERLRDAAAPTSSHAWRAALPPPAGPMPAVLPGEELRPEVRARVGPPVRRAVGGVTGHAGGAARPG